MKSCQGEQIWEGPELYHLKFAVNVRWVAFIWTKIKHSKLVFHVLTESRFCEVLGLGAPKFPGKQIGEWPGKWPGNIIKIITVCLIFIGVTIIMGIINTIISMMMIGIIIIFIIIIFMRVVGGIWICILNLFSFVRVFFYIVQIRCEDIHTMYMY